MDQPQVTAPAANPDNTPTSSYNFLGDIIENYLTEYWIGKKPINAGDPILWVYLGDGITNITPKYTDKKKTAAYYNGGGNETTTVTGVTASYDITGDRSYHNPAQDILANMKLATGTRRELWFRKNEYTQNADASLTLIKSEFGLATFSDIDDGGGAADDNGQFKVTSTYKATPKVIGENAYDLLNQIILQTPSQNAGILNVNVKQPVDDKTYKMFAPTNVIADTGAGDPNNSKPADIATARELAGESVINVTDDSNNEANDEDKKITAPSNTKVTATSDGAIITAE